MSNGLKEELVRWPPANREMAYMSRDLIKDAFGRNYELLKLIGSSGAKQLEELRTIYGLCLSKKTYSQLKNGHRFKCGLLLLVTLKHYWLVKGYEFRIDNV